MSDLKCITPEIEEEIVLRITDAVRFPLPDQLDWNTLVQELKEKPMRAMEAWAATQPLRGIVEEHGRYLALLAHALGIDIDSVLKRLDGRSMSDIVKKLREEE